MRVGYFFRNKRARAVGVEVGDEEHYLITGSVHNEGASVWVLVAGGSPWRVQKLLVICCLCHKLCDTQKRYSCRFRLFPAY